MTMIMKYKMSGNQVVKMLRIYQRVQIQVLQALLDLTRSTPVTDMPSITQNKDILSDSKSVRKSLI